MLVHLSLISNDDCEVCLVLISPIRHSVSTSTADVVFYTSIQCNDYYPVEQYDPYTIDYDKSTTA